MVKAQRKSKQKSKVNSQCQPKNYLHGGWENGEGSGQEGVNKEDNPFEFQGSESLLNGVLVWTNILGLKVLTALKLNSTQLIAWVKQFNRGSYRICYNATVTHRPNLQSKVLNNLIILISNSHSPFAIAYSHSQAYKPKGSMYKALTCGRFPSNSVKDPHQMPLRLSLVEWGCQHGIRRHLVILGMQQTGEFPGSERYFIEAPHHIIALVGFPQQPWCRSFSQSQWLLPLLLRRPQTDGLLCPPSLLQGAGILQLLRGIWDPQDTTL